MLKENLTSYDNSVTTEKHSTEINRITVSASWGEIKKNSAMPNAQRAPFYARLFEELLEKYAGQDEITLYTQQGTSKKTDIEELRSCKQIYTDDHTETFWKARTCIPRSEKLFLASSGLLVEIKREGRTCEFGLYYVQIGLNATKRARYYFHNTEGTMKTISPEKLVILVFNGSHSQNVQKLLDTENQKIIFSDAAQVHHIYGYKYGATLEETKKYMPYNCNLQNIQLLTKEEHLALRKYNRNIGKEKVSAFFDKLVEASDGNVNGFIGYGRAHGEVIFDTFSEEAEEQNTQK